MTEGITVNTWVILTADSAEITGARVGEPVEITVNFRHTNSTGGTVAELTGEFPELEVYGYALDGEITESNITLNNVATLYFTPDEVGETTVYAVAGNVMLPIKVIVEDTPQPVDIVYVSLTGNDGNAGTYEAPVATIAKAVELANKEMEENIAYESKLRDRLIEGIEKEIPYARINGDRKARLSNNVNACFRFVEGESLLIMLDQKGICASSGSACTSGSLDPSHVLLAFFMTLAP